MSFSLEKSHKIWYKYYRYLNFICVLTGGKNGEITNCRETEHYQHARL